MNALSSPRCTRCGWLVGDCTCVAIEVTPEQRAALGRELEAYGRHVEAQTLAHVGRIVVGVRQSFEREVSERFVAGFDYAIQTVLEALVTQTGSHVALDLEVQKRLAVRELEPCAWR